MSEEPHISKCPACGYDLSAMQGETCSECGVNVAEAHLRFQQRKPTIAPIIVVFMCAAAVWGLMSMALMGAAHAYGYSLIQSATKILLVVCAYTIGAVVAWLFRKDFASLTQRWRKDIVITAVVIAVLPIACMCCIFNAH